MFLKLFLIFSLGLNIFVGLEHYFPKSWKTYLHDHKASRGVIGFITETSLYQFFFPAPPQPTHHDFIRATYQTMKDVHEIFQKYKITYFTDGGTTLGVMRHKGMIPWDNDLDIVVPCEYELRLQSLTSLFNTLGYTLKEVSFGYKILSKKYFLVRGKTGQSKIRVCCDIFLLGSNKEDLFYLKSSARHQWPRAFYKKADVYPLVKRPFGNVEVYTARNPIPYLNRHYGKDWNEIGYEATHAEEVSMKSFKIKDFKPAMPLGPLKDRVK